MLGALKGLVGAGGTSRQLATVVSDLEGLSPTDAMEFLPRWFAQEAGHLQTPKQLEPVLARLDPLLRRRYHDAVIDLLKGTLTPTRLKLFVDATQPCVALMHQRHRDCVNAPRATRQANTTWSAHAGMLHWGTLDLLLTVLSRQPIQPALWADLYDAIPPLTNDEIPAAAQPAARLALARLFVITAGLIADQESSRVLLLDQLATSLAPYVRLGASPSGQVCYRLDAAEPQAPQVMTPETPPALGNSVIYADFDALIIESNRLRDHVTQHGEVPRKLDLGGSLTGAELLAAIRHLHEAWCGRRVTRKHKRQAYSQRVVFTQGVSAILKRLTTRSRAQLSSERHDLVTGDVLDISQSGMGLTVEMANSIRSGQVVALCVASSSQWAVGIVRRKTSLELKRASLGVQILSVSPEAVLLSAVQTPDADNPVVQGGRNFDAIWLPPSMPARHHGMLLVQEQGMLQEGREYMMATGNDRSIVRVIGLAERAEGCFCYITQSADANTPGGAHPAP